MVETRQSDDISNLGIGKLKEIAKSIGLSGYSKYTSATKMDLVKLINKKNSKF